MDLLKTPKPEKMPPNLTDYDKAVAVWDERVGTTLLRARNWRYMALLLGVAIILLLILSIRLSAKPAAIPYVVEIDKIGQIQKIQALRETRYKPTQIVIKSILFEWLKKVRSLPMDPVVLNQWHHEAYWFVTPSIKAKLTQHIQKLRAKFGKITISIAPVSITPISENSYQIIWDESEFKDGVAARKVRWQLILTMSISPPQAEQGVRSNPIGIWIRDFNWGAQLKQEELHD